MLEYIGTLDTNPKKGKQRKKAKIKKPKKKTGKK
jgi:hypothetical protein